MILAKNLKIPSRKRSTHVNGRRFNAAESVALSSFPTQIAVEASLIRTDKPRLSVGTDGVTGVDGME